MPSSPVSRRSFLTSTAKQTAAGAAAFQIIKPELVRGAGKEKLKAGVVGVGGRGRQAAIDLLTGAENVDIVALADVFEDKLEGNLRWMREQNPRFADRVKVEPDKRFVGFDAFKKILATDIDLVILATPPGYRPEHFEAAVAAKKHVFCEKPFGTDPVGVRRFMEAAKKSEELKLTVVSGAQRRFHNAYLRDLKRVQDGEIGDIRALYAYWVGTPVIQNKARDPKYGDMEWQHRNWYSYVWICGDQIVEQHLHNIDVCNWFMGAHPVKVWAHGGRAWRPSDELYGNIYDHIAADFEYPNGVRMASHCRQFERGSYQNVSELIVGSKGQLKMDGRGTGQGDNPYVNEHIALVKSIRGEGPYLNHAMTVAESTMTCIMAREAAYTGEEITWDRIMNSKLDLQPREFGYNLPMTATPIPVPGKYKLI
jgi:predicted dehydrogenase